jgi:hypothetical protein
MDTIIMNRVKEMKMKWEMENSEALKELQILKEKL